MFRVPTFQSYWDSSWCPTTDEVPLVPDSPGSFTRTLPGSV